MANSPRPKWQLSKIDSWFSLAKWVWDRLWAFALSGAGGTAMAVLAQKTSWISSHGPIAWGAVGLTAFCVLYTLFISGRERLAIARRERAQSLLIEHLAEHATINPMEKVFTNKRIYLKDLQDPFGKMLQDKTFTDCDLIGPAVILIGHGTTFRKNNVENNVEFASVNLPKTLISSANKITLIGGAIERCNIYNVIFLVPEEYRATFEGTFNGGLVWMNDGAQPEALTFEPAPSSEEEIQA